MTLHTDFLIVGAGIIGINIAIALKKRFPDRHIIILEKENEIGMHASGRNSGVIHAGFYYTPDSLKARFTREGNTALTQYCLSKKIPIRRCGKLVVARNASELNGLDELQKRGRANQVELEMISAYDAKKKEPRVKTYQRALFSPTTSSVDPKQVLLHLVEDAKSLGIEIHLNTSYLRKENDEIHATNSVYKANFFINAAGLYADKIASDFGFSKNYRILPFKGLYLYGNQDEKLSTNIYPVPDLNNPFLGVHFTITVDGRVKIGPTAIPAFWREQYNGFSRFNFNELLEISRREFRLFFSAGFGFRKLAFQEIKKNSRKVLTQHASELAEGILCNHYKEWGKPGIRAQLLDLRTQQLEMDFVIEHDQKSLHILNAVSPAFTASIPFAEYILSKLPT